MPTITARQVTAALPFFFNWCLRVRFRVEAVVGILGSGLVGVLKVGPQFDGFPVFFIFVGYCSGIIWFLSYHCNHYHPPPSLPDLRGDVKM